MTEPLPDFTFYPGATADGRVHASDRACAACGRARGWISDALLYSENKPDDTHFCPWCIADGTAVSRFGGSFNELEAGVANEQAARTVTERTPNFETWQDWSWPVHCGLPGVYRGQPSGAELRAQPEALAVFLADLSEYRWGRDEAYVAEFVDGLGGSQVAYLFECPSCNVPMVCWDQD